MNWFTSSYILACSRWVRISCTFFLIWWFQTWTVRWWSTCVVCTCCNLNTSISRSKISTTKWITCIYCLTSCYFIRRRWYSTHIISRTSTLSNTSILTIYVCTFNIILLLQTLTKFQFIFICTSNISNWISCAIWLFNITFLLSIRINTSKWQNVTIYYRFRTWMVFTFTRYTFCTTNPSTFISILIKLKITIL